MDRPRPEQLSHLDLVVLTGDIVGSSRLSPAELDAAMDALERASRAIIRHWGFGHARFDRFRGDSWQCIGPTPERSLRAALLLRAQVRGLGRSHDTRVSIGIGPGHLPSTPDLGGAGGPAFELSGHGLDAMGHAPRFALAWTEPPQDAGLFRAVFALADDVSRRWTPRQAQVFALVLAPAARPSQEALAETLGIRQQVVARHLSAGGDWALREALAALEGA